MQTFEIIIQNVAWADGDFVNVTIIDLELEKHNQISFNYGTDIEVPDSEQENFTTLVDAAVSTLISSIFNKR